MLSRSDAIILKRIIWKKRFLIVTVIGTLIAGTVFIVFLARGITQSSAQALKTQNEIRSLKKKVSAVDNATVSELKEAQKSIELFLPKEFDMFSVISFIDVVSRRTNLRVDSIVLSGGSQPANQVKKKEVNILGDMTFEEFLAFLEKYKYITGRFLAIKNVNITTLDSDSIRLSAEIYTYDPAIDLNTFIIGPLGEKEREVLAKIIEATKNSELPSNAVDDNYSNKTDPFE